MEEHIPTDKTKFKSDNQSEMNTHAKKQGNSTRNTEKN
jgi:hypothetical protein